MKTSLAEVRAALNSNAVSTYVPNVTDPKYKDRTITRMKHALGWSLAVVGEEPRELSKNMIDDAFGRKDLGLWLRVKLLTCTDQFFTFGGDSKCKMYTLNQTGVAEVRSILMGAEPTVAIQQPTSESDVNGAYDLKVVLHFVQQEFSSELETKEFKYEEKDCARLWHPLQNLKRGVKTAVWQEYGLTYNYDIQACAPTLILQHAQKLDMDEWLFGINDYLDNTADFREHIAKVADIEYKKAKVLVNALFCGARLGANNAFALYALLDYDKTKVEALQNDSRLSVLRDDIKKCWVAIEPTLPQATQGGKKIRVNSRMKWNRYFELERAVLNVVRSHLQSSGIKCFLEHDGWRSDKEVDVVALEDLVASVIGFRIKLVLSSS